MRTRAWSGAAMLALAACARPLTLSRDDSDVVLATQTLDAPSPAEAGPLRVLRLFYGSGNDARRREFRDSVAIRTATVDASPFVTLEPPVAAARRAYWGFDVRHVPLNGRVWYPDGPGPYPLVLIVHGNHDMKDFSDPGYEYLGQLLASRGFILASVDENFLNGAIRGENDARGWVLLQHLRAWRAFNDSAAALRGKVDMRAIALIGHSRGGEAVAHAAAFNRMRYFPDDATVPFDFGFAITSLVAIAPVDGQYRPAGRLEPVTDVNYLVFHGSHDGDVTTFHGLRQWQRIQFTDTLPRFKAALYMYRANHGQWNTRWGSTDAGPRSARFLDLRGLIDPEAQRQVARIYIAAFLEATLRGRSEYLPLFRDHRVIGGWLPRTMYITRLQDESFRPVANFEEDVDVSTGTAPGVTLRGDSLAVWRENVIPYRSSGGDVQNNSAVWLGWNNRIAGTDTTRMGAPGTYTITLPDTLARSWRLDESAELALSLTGTPEIPPPRASARDSAARADSARRSERGPRRRTPNASLAGRAAPAPRDTVPIDLSVEVEDAAGVTARVPLSRYGAVRRPLVTHVLRRADREQRSFARPFEYVLQTFVIPLADFAAAEPRWSASRLRRVRLRFDRAPYGTVILDDVGFMHLRPEFFERRHAAR